MRASVLRDGRMVFCDDVPEPVPAAGQVLVGVKACGICGSDLHFAKHGEQMMELGRQMQGMPTQNLGVELSGDIFMGHEFSAEIFEAGPDTEAPAPGTVVTSVPVLLSPTGMDMIFQSNTTVDPRHAALTEPMAVGLHAVNKSGVRPGETALVLGCGPIGLAIIAALRHRGVEHIVASDYSPVRRRLSERMGAHETVDPAEASPFDGSKTAVVFEAVGVPGIINDVLRRAPRGSRLVVAGVCMEPDTVLPFFGTAKEISVHFVFAYDQAEFAESLRAIADGDIDVGPLITGEVGLDGVGAVFGELAAPDTHCKVLVRPQ